MHLNLFTILIITTCLFSSLKATSEESSDLLEFFKREESHDEGEDWVDLTTGVMMKAHESSNPQTSLTRRDGFPVKRQSTEILVERDSNSGTLILPRSWNEIKGFVRRGLPGFVHHHVKRGKKHMSRSMKVVSVSFLFCLILTFLLGFHSSDLGEFSEMDLDLEIWVDHFWDIYTLSLSLSSITWYTGHDLLYPSCVQKTQWSPTDSSMVGAVTIQVRIQSSIKFLFSKKKKNLPLPT